MASSCVIKSEFFNSSISGFNSLSGIDVIVDDEPVIARAHNLGPRDSLQAQDVVMTPVPLSQGIHVQFITAELARKYANATPKEISEPTNAVAGFEGKPISRDVTLVGVSLSDRSWHLTCMND